VRLAARLAAGALALALPMGSPARASPAGPPQFLPIEAEWCLELGCIQLEVPRGEQQFAWGMQLRPALGQLRGMWFHVEPAQALNFWMHRTLTPLDMVFIRDGRVIAIEANVQPCPRLPCPSYGPGQPANGVVELDAGEAARLGIEVGSRATIEAKPINPPGR
jgi:uncharacterized membrane protein (UPF0127 family)